MDEIIEACRLAANNKVYHLAVSTSHLGELFDFGEELIREMDANCLSFSTIQDGANYGDVIIRGILPISSTY